jgi:hypothetical protein
MPGEAGESFSIKGPRGITAMILIGLAGGGIGATGVGIAGGRDATEPPLPFLSRAEIETIAAQKADRAEERAKAVAVTESGAALATAKEGCERRLAEEMAKITRKLEKLDDIATDVAVLRGAMRIKK